MGARQPIQGSDLAIAILTGIAMALLFLTLKFINQQDRYRPLVLCIEGVGAVIGIFYLSTRFFNMYNVLAGKLAIRLAFIILLLVFILILALIGNLDKHMYFSLITSLVGFIAGLGFSRYIFQ